VAGVAELGSPGAIAVMKQKVFSTFRTAVLLVAILTIGLFSAVAQDCRLQIRFAGFTPLKYYTVLMISFAPTTNSCAGVKAAVDWSDDLVTWKSVEQAGGLPCVTSGAEVQVIDETDSRSTLRRFYRVRQAGSCP
jgi:hypothetical protein